TNTGDETPQSQPVSVTPALTTVNHAVRLTGIPRNTDVAVVVVARRIYRTDANGNIFRLVATLNDNTTQEFIDRFGDGGIATRPADGLAVADAAGGQLARGTYNYRVTFLDTRGVESQPSTAVPTANLAAAGQKVNLTNIPLGPDGTLARRLYRTDANGKV